MATTDLAMSGYHEIINETETVFLSLLMIRRDLYGTLNLRKISSDRSLSLASLFGVKPVKELFFPPYSYSINNIHIN